MEHKQADASNTTAINNKEGLICAAESTLKPIIFRKKLNKETAHNKNDNLCLSEKHPAICIPHAILAEKVIALIKNIGILF